MKLFDIDWQDFLWRTVIWDRISPESRRAFLQIQANANTPTAPFGDDLGLLLEHRFLEGIKTGRCRLYQSCRGFLGAARAMDRQLLFSSSATCDLARYLDVHFHRDEREGLSPGPDRYSFGDRHLSRILSSVSWVRSFLAAEDTAAWEHKRRRDWSSPARFPSADVAAAARQLIRRLMADPQPVPFLRLPDLLPDASVDVIGATIFATLRYALLFAGMDDDRTPRIGFWPEVAERLKRPPAKQPAPVQPEQQFHAALALEDLTTLVVAAAGRPLRLRAGDGRLFAKVVKDLQPRLLALPEWLPATLAAKEAEDRLQRAQVAGVEMHLLVGHRGRPVLQASASAQRWLAGTPKERLRELLAHAVTLSKRTFGMEHVYGPNLQCKPDLPASLNRAYGSLPGEHFVRLDEFLAWHVEQSNPYVALAEADKRVRLRSAWYHYDPTLEEMENQWRCDLADFAVRVLLPVGGLKIGCLEPAGRLCLALTDVGRFYLGQSTDFEYEPDRREEGQVVVQPNFEVVFLSPAPLAEAALARIADRKGAALGALFQLTKSSIFAAAGAGMTCDRVLDTLRRVSIKELPKNVEREIEGWFGQCRTVAVNTTTLIHCPDAATAARVIAACGKTTELLTETIVAVADPKEQQTVIQKLSRAGIFIDRDGRKKAKSDG